MAGHQGLFVYISDNGERYLLRCDKSNALQSGTGLVLAQDTDMTLPYAPRGIKYRCVTWITEDKRYVRKIYCGTPDAPMFSGQIREITMTDFETGADIKYRPRGYFGEKRLSRRQPWSQSIPAPA